jgi:hypothetical protein
MEIYRLKEMSAEDRDSVLLGEALSVEEQAYMKPLSPEEISIRKDDLASAAILKAVIEDELSEIKKQYKDKIEPLRTKVSEAIEAIKNKAVEVKGKVYKLADYENQMIHYVDPLGNVLSSRRMLPEEKQFRISVNQKEAI